MMCLKCAFLLVGLVYSDNNFTSSTSQISSVETTQKSELLESIVFKKIVSSTAALNYTDDVSMAESTTISTIKPFETSNTTPTTTSTYVKSTIDERVKNRPVWSVGESSRTVGESSRTVGESTRTVGESSRTESSLSRKEKLEIERRMEMHRQMKLAKERARDEQRREIALKRAKLEKQATKEKHGEVKEKKPVKATLSKKNKHKLSEKAKAKELRREKEELAEKLKEEREKVRIESLKRQILDKVRLSESAPLRRPQVPLHFLQRSILGDESDDDGDDDRAKTTDMLVFGQDITRRCRHRKSTGCFKFNLRNKIEGRVLSAELFIYKLRDPNDGQQSILLSELERPKFSKLVPKNLVSRLDTDISEGWLRFSLDKAVQKWAEKPLTNDGIALKCKTCARHGHKKLYSAKEGYKPVLIIHIDPSSHRGRHKRHVDCGDEVTGCCKHSFYVNFKDINLAQILYPDGIWANYCTGSCHVDINIPGTYNHTDLLQNFRTRSESANDTIREAVVPCCGAVRLKTVSLLYSNGEGDIVHSHVPDLSVEKCGCL